MLENKMIGYIHPIPQGNFLNASQSQSSPYSSILHSQTRPLQNSNEFNAQQSLNLNQKSLNSNEAYEFRGNPVII